MSSVTDESTGKRRRNLLVILPLAVFVGLAVLFFVRLWAGDPSHLPSALIGRPAPQTDLPPLAGLERDGKALPGLSNKMFEGNVTLVNVWASWCVPCADEVPHLAKLARDKRIQLVGINYKDAPANARKFLDRYGNPYVASGVDANGRTSIDWGVYGVPETYVIDRKGTITYKLVGPVTAENLVSVLEPEIAKATAR
jgi:cytochrome c biogenesis protein CcmG/thiol:disulfide interchange protein DsbE